MFKPQILTFSWQENSLQTFSTSFYWEIFFFRKASLFYEELFYFRYRIYPTVIQQQRVETH